MYFSHLYFFVAPVAPGSFPRLLAIPPPGRLNFAKLPRLVGRRKREGAEMDETAAFIQSHHHFNSVHSGTPDREAKVVFLRGIGVDRITLSFPSFPFDLSLFPSEICVFS